MPLPMRFNLLDTVLSAGIGISLAQVLMYYVPGHLGAILWGGRK